MNQSIMLLVEANPSKGCPKLSNNVNVLVAITNNIGLVRGWERKWREASLSTMNPYFTFHLLLRAP